jgi:hypothetical protein
VTTWRLLQAVATVALAWFTLRDAWRAWDRSDVAFLMRVYRREGLS